MLVRWIPFVCFLSVLGLSSVASAASPALPTPQADATAMQPLRCAHTLRDQSFPSECIAADSTARQGFLFPYPGRDNSLVPLSFVGGGQNNHATSEWSTVAGGRDNVAAGPYGGATVGGGRENTASGTGATIAGGGGYDSYYGIAFGNIASGELASIGGGGSNTASGQTSTIGGGSSNRATGFGTTVSGGGGHSATGTASTIGGGSGHETSGFWSTVGGGLRNTAQGYGSTIPGGRWNTATGRHGFAAGHRARSEHDGAFVWGDSLDVDKLSSRADEFSVYASGGARFFTDAAATTGVALAPGGGSWSTLSDRAAKEDVRAVDASAVLDQVVGLPVATWSYRSQDGVVHMGPMAQDFHAAFGLGSSERLIDTVDADGVALAAIQGLNARLTDELRARDREIEALRADLAAVRQLLRKEPLRESAR